VAWHEAVSKAKNCQAVHRGGLSKTDKLDGLPSLWDQSHTSTGSV